MTDLLQGSELVAADGRRVRLGRRLGQGGEGTIFELAGEEGLVAKIFRQPLPAERADKIRLMAGLRSASIDAVAAWPIELLALPSGEPIGLSLPRVAGAHDIHQLYSPKSRRQLFPAADWRFLIRVASSLCRAFAAVHEGGSVIADVNPGGILVGEDGQVRLIDCDSFQVEAGGKRFLCDVGVAAFTPPELQGRPFVGLARSAEHDNFGLAVLAFLLLFMGRHPFAGRYLGSEDMPIERAIAEHRFAFGAGRQAVRMEPPPGAPPLAIVPPHLEALFERAFASDAAVKGRPAAREWAAALGDFQSRLTQCGADRAHWHWPGLAACPWCALEAATGSPLFSDTISPLTAGLFDIAEFWQQVEAVEHPGPAPRADWNESVAVSDDVRTLTRGWNLHTPIAMLVAAVPVALVFAVDAPALAGLLALLCAIPLFVVVRKVLRSVGDTSSLLEWMLHCRNEWEAARREWNAKAGPGAFELKRRELDGLRAAWERKADPAERQAIEARLRRGLNELQQARNQIEFARTSLKEKCEQAHRAYLQSEADLKAIQS
jgi:DNA-binding helix-hairpin-helix protein with protein kinase domain